MKLAFAGKGGVGKTTLCAWMGDFLSRQGHGVWLVDADTSLSLGAACGLAPEEIPTPLARREDLVRERIGQGLMSLSPDVDDLPGGLCVVLPGGGGPGWRRLLVMGGVDAGGGGCACAASALLKAVLAHMVLCRGEAVLVDLEAGVEHLGRGTVERVDGLVLVAEPGLRALRTAAQAAQMAWELGLERQVLALNGCGSVPELPEVPGLPEAVVAVPHVQELAGRKLAEASVLGLSDRPRLDEACAALVRALAL